MLGSTPPGGDPLVVVAPVAGVLVALEDLPDPVFAQRLVGGGIAIEPTTHEQTDAAGTTADQPVVAPVSGRVASLLRHAFSIDGGDGRTVLVHLGLGDVRGAEAQFGSHVEVGASVGAGDCVLEWSPAGLRAQGLAPLCPVVALQSGPATIEVLRSPGDAVAAGEPLFVWH